MSQATGHGVFFFFYLNVNAHWWLQLLLIDGYSCYLLVATVAAHWWLFSVHGTVEWNKPEENSENLLSRS